MQVDTGGDHNAGLSRRSPYPALSGQHNNPGLTMAKTQETTPRTHAPPFQLSFCPLLCPIGTQSHERSSASDSGDRRAPPSRPHCVLKTAGRARKLNAIDRSFFSCPTDGSNARSGRCALLYRASAKLLPLSLNYAVHRPYPDAMNGTSRLSHFQLPVAIQTHL